MARQPVQFMRVGRADILTAAAFDAYVGPAGEVVVDHVRGIMALHDGAKVGGIQFRADAGTSRSLSFNARLSLTEGVAVPESDVTGAATIRLVPMGGNSVPVKDGADFLPGSIGGGLSLPLDANSGHLGYHQAGKNFDLFAIRDGAVIRLVSGPAWSTDVSRGTGSGTTELDSAAGILVNKNDIVVRYGLNSGDTVTCTSGKGTYLGSFRATGDGQATDRKSKRLLFNAYNRIIRPVKVTEPTASWTYSTAAFRQANGSAANQIEVLHGLSGILVDLQLVAVANSSTATARTIRNAIGLDSVTSRAPDCPGGVTSVSNVTATQFSTSFKGLAGLGFHYFAWLEYGAGTDAQNWFGKDVTNNLFEMGLYGTVTC